MEGAVHGNRETKDRQIVNSFLTAVMETDSARDTKGGCDKEKWRLKEMVNNSCSVSHWRETGGYAVHQEACGNGTSISLSLIHAPC